MSKEEARRWIVLKFGGTSVSRADYWRVICTQARARLAEGHHVLIAISAVSGVTDLLTRLATTLDAQDRQAELAAVRAKHQALFDDLGMAADAAFEAAWSVLEQQTSDGTGLDGPAHRAAILANGERLSTVIGARVMREAGLAVHLQDVTTLLKADGGEDDSPVAASCSAFFDAGVEQRLAGQGALHLTQGFLCGGADGHTWLLGRGGSDTSAALLASRVQAERLEIWTDVPGMFSADPRVVPHARLLRRLSYSEAQELASMGAKVLHPPSVRTCREARIPLHIRDTTRPEIPGTRIGPRQAESEARVKGIVTRKNVTLVMMENPAMWRQVGFLAEAFECFRRHGLSVDLVATSESSVTVSLDPARPGTDDTVILQGLVDDLSPLCSVEVRYGCVSISLVGNSIRTFLGQLSEALDVFQDRQVHMVTQSANDLNLTLVVDAEHADQLVQKLHHLLIPVDEGPQQAFGAAWNALVGPTIKAQDTAWWRGGAAKLIELMEGRDAAYVYDLATVRGALQRVRALPSVKRVLYAVKANDNADILRALSAGGAGFDCVALPELEHVLAAVPDLDASGLLFTPNFAPRSEYAAALELGVQLTIDNLHPLERWPELFAGRQVFLRVDLDLGHGHHRKVVTSGARSKFGISARQLKGLNEKLKALDITVTGLHAHTGSGVMDAGVWGEQLKRMLKLREQFPEVRVLDLGGGLGVPDRLGVPILDLAALEQRLAQVAKGADVDVWLEPGRYLVAEAGVLLARVTQLKSKGEQHYLGLATGMNSLIRPALYGAYHRIVNLSRLNEKPSVRYTVVGPICESGDVLGESRMLPPAQEGDVMLIANAGAYGRVMASHYNRRDPAEELVIDG